VAGLARRVDLVPGRDYRFRVRAFDHAGNASAPAWGPTMGLRRIDDDAAAIRYSSGWKTVQAGSASGGTVHRSSARGATARITVTGRAFAWVAPTGPSRGSAEVRVDGRLVATVSLRSASSEPRRVVWSRAWAASGRHTIEIRVKGTSGHPAVAIDGFLVLD